MNLKQALIENNSIRLGLEAADWKEAVKLTVEPLIESGAILPEYYDAIIESTEEYGPYYILMPGMAMPHARPEAGVQRDAFSLITLQGCQSKEEVLDMIEESKNSPYLEGLDLES